MAPKKSLGHFPSCPSPKARKTLVCFPSPCLLCICLPDSSKNETAEPTISTIYYLLYIYIKIIYFYREKNSSQGPGGTILSLFLAVCLIFVHVWYVHVTLRPHCCHCHCFNKAAMQATPHIPWLPLLPASFGFRSRSRNAKTRRWKELGDVLRFPQRQGAAAATGEITYLKCNDMY